MIDRDGSPGAQDDDRDVEPADRRRAARDAALRRSPRPPTCSPSSSAAGARTIVFMKSRKAVELMARFAQLALEDLGRPASSPTRIAPYRAGYTPQQRRELERRLVDGELLGVVSTDALELGIDIGSLDAAICVTFPGTVASLRQMWGRAGRRGRGLARLRRRRGRARPVLLPPSRRVPRPARRGGDPRSRERADPRRARALRRARGTARAGRRGVPRAGAAS